MDIMIMLVIVAGATAAILRISGYAARSPFSVSSLRYINIQLKHQLLLLGVSLLVLLTLYLTNSQNLMLFLSAGNIEAQANEVIWLGISGNATWLWLGLGLSFFITLGTSIFIVIQVRQKGLLLGYFLPFIPWVLLFSATNAFSEEVVYRLGVIIPLIDSVDTTYIALISAVAFGAPHLRGMPNGIIGALMAGFLGWLLAKSVLETHGIFWAWFIHFLQDVVIFSGFVIAATNQSLSQQTRYKPNATM